MLRVFGPVRGPVTARLMPAQHRVCGVEGVRAQPRRDG
ncbi:hypothetical protein SEA_MURP_77 [Gordonia phage Murp]|nr:hypothetical protein SEA_MURP_77 [Gordonia phage Murp]